MVDSIDSSAVCGQLLFFRLMQLSSLYSADFTSSDTAYDEFIKLQVEKFTQTVVEIFLKFLPLSHLSSFVYVFKLY